MFIFNAQYLPVLDLFAAKNDVRYYLGGYHVAPHPEGGALLSATDGHILCIIHDPDGRCRGEHIVARSPNLVRHGKLTKKERKHDYSAWCAWGGLRKKSRLTIRTNYGTDPIPATNSGPERYVAPGYADDFLIDGKFPDTDRVLPRESQLRPGLTGFMNPVLLNIVHRCTEELRQQGLTTPLAPGVCFWEQADTPEDSVKVVAISGTNSAPVNLRILMMPMSPSRLVAGKTPEERGEYYRPRTDHYRKTPEKEADPA